MKCSEAKDSIIETDYTEIRKLENGECDVVMDPNRDFPYHL